MQTSSDAREFAEDLKRIETRIRDDTQTFEDMPADGKRKCIDDLESTIQSLQKIKRDLKEAEDSSPDKNLVQVLWNYPGECTFAKLDFEQAFLIASSRRSAIPVPRITSVVMHDNFSLDGDKKLQPTRMCFIKFLTEDDACLALELKEMRVRSKPSSCSLNVQFIQPAQSLATHKTFRIIGKSLARLEEINKELKKIGSIRQGGMPALGPGFQDKAWYLTKLQECKRLRAAGVSLGLHDHAPLAAMKPVDSAALKQEIKRLYDEECDILILLREYQLNGLDFDFKHPAH